LSEEKLALSTALEQLRMVNAEKTEILTIVSHDLKNPLNAIMGFGEMIINGAELGLQQDNYIHLGKEICTVSSRMARLIKNLLDIQAVEDGMLELNIIPLNVASVLSSMSADFEARAAAKNITLRLDAPDLHCMADEVFYQQIIENLLSNAVKYSPHSKQVWIRAAQKGNAIRVEVQDEGPGIAAEEMPRLFQKFTRLSARPTGGEDSTGLGLAIVKKLVEVMQGHVWCESEEGQGAMFVVEMPAQ
jgi:signal transduction histidine kinase